MRVPLLDIPSVASLVDRVVGDLWVGRNVLLIAPASQPARRVREALTARLYQKGSWYEDLALVDLDNRWEGCVAQLSEVFGVSPVPQTLAALTESEQVPEIVLLDTSNGSPAKVESWLHFIHTWAEHAKHLRDIANASSSKTLCLLLSAPSLPDVLPGSDVALAIHWWWKVPSILETQLVCRTHHTEASLQARWREHILPSLAGSDPGLLEHLWDLSDLSPDGLSETLAEYGTSFGWKRQIKIWRSLLKRKKLPRINGAWSSERPPESWRPLWDHGALCYTVEYGFEIHSAALALLDMQPELEQRVWRGQTTLLLPMLDGVRLALCRHLTRRYGSEWPLEWAEPQNRLERHLVRQSPLAVQWGHLKQAIVDSPHSKRLVLERRIAIIGSSIRNELAHCRTVEYRRFQAMWEDWENLAQHL